MNNFQKSVIVTVGLATIPVFISIPLRKQEPREFPEHIEQDAQTKNSLALYVVEDMNRSAIVRSASIVGAGLINQIDFKWNIRR